VGVVAEDVTACHLALMATKKSVLVMPAWPLMVANQSAHKQQTKITLIGIWTSNRIFIHNIYISKPLLPCIKINKYSLGHYDVNNMKNKSVLIISVIILFVDLCDRFQF
jgi:hypothetical protein